MDYEIILTSKTIAETDWQSLIQKIAEMLGAFANFEITVNFDLPLVRYFLRAPRQLPASINGAEKFLIRPETNMTKKNIKFLAFLPLLVKPKWCAVDIYYAEKKTRLEKITIKFQKLKGAQTVASGMAYYNNSTSRMILPCSAGRILRIDFEANRQLLPRTKPKYVDINKALRIFDTSPNDTILEVDGFPYLDHPAYITLDKIDYAKHSIVFGASGCGKSKFISLLIQRMREQKVIIIDPHAALVDDLGDEARTIDFRTEDSFLNLFTATDGSAVTAVELFLDVFRGLIPNNYNSKLERMLRHSLYLLVVARKFNFTNLRILLLDLEFRSDLVAEMKRSLPTAVVEFFLSEYNDIRTTSYTEAISPIIALIDELEMVPVFNHETVASGLEEMIRQNDTVLFSLDRTMLGDRATETIAGFVMSQLLNLIQNRKFNEQIMLIIDEVAVVENPVLLRFLSEARKYNCAVILAGQYFGALSKELRTAIFANVVNYYVFRVARDDAMLLANALTLKIPLDDTEDAKIKLLTGLQNRECLARISAGEELLPGIKCKTMEFKGGK